MNSLKLPVPQHTYTKRVAESKNRQATVGLICALGFDVQLELAAFRLEVHFLRQLVCQVTGHQLEYILVDFMHCRS